MTNIHATECRAAVERYLAPHLDPQEALDGLGALALTYAAKCDGLEATLARRDHPAFAPAWTAAR